MLTILNFIKGFVFGLEYVIVKIERVIVLCCGGGSGGLCGGLLMGFCSFWFYCTMSSDCRLKMNCLVFGPPEVRRLGCFCDLSVLGARTGLYLSLNLGGGCGNMRFSYLLSICLTILRCLGTGFLILSLVLGAGTGLYPSQNCGGGGNMRYSYSLTICLTLSLGLGTGFLIVSLALEAVGSRWRN